MSGPILGMSPHFFNGLSRNPTRFFGEAERKIHSCFWQGEVEGAGGWVAILKSTQSTLPCLKIVWSEGSLFFQGLTNLSFKRPERRNFQLQPHLVFLSHLLWKNKMKMTCEGYRLTKILRPNHRTIFHPFPQIPQVPHKLDSCIIITGDDSCKNCKSQTLLKGCLKEPKENRRHKSKDSRGISSLWDL